MLIVVPFTKYGIPVDGSGDVPNIIIRDAVTGVELINDSMVYLENGFYKYDFLGYDSEMNYAIVCDGGPLIPQGERYRFAGNDNFIEDISSVVLESSQEIIQEIRLIDKGPPTAKF